MPAPTGAMLPLAAYCLKAAGSPPTVSASGSAEYTSQLALPAVVRALGPALLMKGPELALRMIVLPVVLEDETVAPLPRVSPEPADTSRRSLADRVPPMKTVCVPVMVCVPELDRPDSTRTGPALSTVMGPVAVMGWSMVTVPALLFRLSATGPWTLQAPGCRWPAPCWFRLSPVKPEPTLLPAARLKACVTVRVLKPVSVLSEPKLRVPMLAAPPKFSEPPPCRSTRLVLVNAPLKFAVPPARMDSVLPLNWVARLDVPPALSRLPVFTCRRNPLPAMVKLLALAVPLTVMVPVESM